jgi:hypothetical protein
LQKFPSLQSASTAQLVLHVVDPHAYGAHGVVAPSHVRSVRHVPVVCAASFQHPAIPQLDPTGGGAPSHRSGHEPAH